MPSWNQLFLDPRHVKRAPESEIYRFVQVLESAFPAQPLHIWDLCCGAGRHTVALAQTGHTIYASDNASHALRLTQEWLADLGLSAHVAEGDMTACPWPEVRFHGVVCWDALYHNTRSQMQRAIDNVYACLVPGGFFLLTLKSTRADLYGQGERIEPDTFVMSEGSEAGVPHHYSDEADVRSLFQGWDLVSLAEQVVRYAQRGRMFLDHNPFPYTSWGVLARKAA